MESAMSGSGTDRKRLKPHSHAHHAEMPKFLVATPIKPNTINKEHFFSGGISIRNLPRVSKASLAILRPVVPPKIIDHIADTPYWLAAEAETEDPAPAHDDALYLKATNAARALQIVCPVGAKHVFIQFKAVGDDLEAMNAKIGTELHSTLVGRTAFLEDQPIDQTFDPIYTGILRAFDERIVRLQNPILLLEHGMQTCNPNLAALLFTMALDALVMAGESKPFVSRLGGFLRPDTFVFPQDSFMHRQPTTKVGDVLAPLYKFRSLIAHGQEISKQPYRQSHPLLDTNGAPVPDTHYPYTYTELMRESALFILTAALRKVFTEDLVNIVKCPRRWRAELKRRERLGSH
jgi:hypothetical protein